MPLPNRPIEFAWLEDFLALAESGSFSRAAELRNIAQPAFSRHIRSLEDWIGVTLFDRSTHPAAMTEAGRRFSPMVRDLLHRLEIAREETRLADETASATLRFAATHVLSLTFFPHWLRSIVSDVRPAPIHLGSDSLHACEGVMLHGDVHFLLCHYHRQVGNRLDPEQYNSAAVGFDTLVPVVKPRGPMLPAFGHERGSRGKLPVLAYSEESGLGRIVRARLGAALEQIGADLLFTAHLAAVLRTMALEGRGIAWLPETLIAEDIAAKRLVRAGDAKWNIPVEIRIFRRRGLERPVAEQFWATIVAHAAKATPAKMIRGKRIKAG
jgi:DNA-binding transcriptional LysR family regulator